MAVGVAIDEPRNDEAARCVEDLGAGARDRARRHDVNDGIALDHDVAQLAARRLGRGLGRMHEAV